MYISEKLESLIRKNSLVRTLFWFINMFSLYIYMFLSYLIVNNIREKSGTGSEEHITMLALFICLAVFSIILSLIIKRFFLSKAALKNYLTGKGGVCKMNKFNSMLRNDFEPFMNPAKSSTKVLKDLDETELKLYDYSKESLTVYLIFLVAINSIAITGLFLSLLTKEFFIALPFIAIAFTALLINFPNLRQNLEDGLRCYRATAVES